MIDPEIDEDEMNCPGKMKEDNSTYEIAMFFMFFVSGTKVMKERELDDYLEPTVSLCAESKSLTPELNMNSDRIGNTSANMYHLD